MRQNRHTIRLAVVLLGLALGGSAQAEGGTGPKGWQGPKPQKPDCTCRKPGGARAQVGEVMCVQIGERTQAMRCEMTLNNTIWKPVRQNCEIVS
ncbi:MAG: hypothetical protein AAFV62_00960 [Pseudomonadota bacterium]